MTWLGSFGTGIPQCNLDLGLDIDKSFNSLHDESARNVFKILLYCALGMMTYIEVKMSRITLTKYQPHLLDFVLAIQPVAILKIPIEIYNFLPKTILLFCRFPWRSIELCHVNLSSFQSEFRDKTFLLKHNTIPHASPYKWIHCLKVYSR